ncbi:MAG: hypothetical protein AAF998_10850 [Bacteroidota bacterium]
MQPLVERPTKEKKPSPPQHPVPAAPLPTQAPALPLAFVPPFAYAQVQDPMQLLPATGGAVVQALTSGEKNYLAENTGFSVPAIQALEAREFSLAQGQQLYETGAIQKRTTCNAERRLLTL